MSSPQRLALLSLLAIASSACNQVLGIEAASLAPDAGHRTAAAPAERKTCVLNSDCEKLEMCIFRVCSQPCALDRDCGGDLQCLRSKTAPRAWTRTTTSATAMTRAPTARAASTAPAEPAAAKRTARCARKASNVWRAAAAPITVPDLDAGADVDAATSIDVMPECKKGEKRCQDASLLTCRSDGRWDQGSPCAYACVDDACTGSCVPTDRQCLDNTLQYCDDQGEWQDETQCPSVCTTDGCVDRCEAGTRQCNNLDLLICTNAGAFKKDKTCDYVCKSGACIGTCVPDSKQCTDGVPQVCDRNGDFQDGADCEFVCSGDQCGGECKPSDTTCEDAANVRVCGGDGMWGAPTPCQNICDTGADQCGGECKPDDTKCEDALRVRTCGDDGMWGSPTACKYVCDASANACGGECVPDDTQCSDGTHVKTCGNDGTWGTPAACQFVCDSKRGDCGGECNPGAYSCNNKAPSTSQRMYCDAGTLTLSKRCGNYPSELCEGTDCAANNARKLGFATKLGVNSSIGGNSLAGIPITVDRRVTLLRLGLYGRATASTDVKMALYSDNGAGANSAPQTLVVFSTAISLSEGQIYPTITAAPILNPGKYWLVVAYSGNGGSTYAVPTGGAGRAIVAVNQTYADPFPETFPTGGNVTAISNYDLNHFLEVRNSL